MLEQMPPFLISLWLHALFVDAEMAGYLGFLYTFTRCFYYVLYNSKLLVPIVTGPNYAIIAYLIVSVLIKAF